MIDFLEYSNLARIIIYFIVILEYYLVMQYLGHGQEYLGDLFVQYYY